MPLAAVLGQVTGRPVEVEAYEKVSEFLRALESLPTFIFCKIVVGQESKASSLGDLVGQGVLLPPANVMTAKLAIAAFADAKGQRRADFSDSVGSPLGDGSACHQHGLGLDRDRTCSCRRRRSARPGRPTLR